MPLEASLALFPGERIPRERWRDVVRGFRKPLLYVVTPQFAAQADSLNDNGTVIKASKWGERALTNEPLFMGDPILAVAAVDELACAEAIERIKIDFEELPFVIDPLESLRPGGPNPREDGNVWVRPEPPAPPIPQLTNIKWTEEDFKEYDQGKLPMGHAPDEWSFGDLDAGFKNAALILDETFITPDVSHQCLETRTAMAYWQNGKLFLHSGTQSTFQTKPTRGSKAVQFIFTPAEELTPLWPAMRS